MSTKVTVKVVTTNEKTARYVVEANPNGRGVKWLKEKYAIVSADNETACQVVGVNGHMGTLTVYGATLADLGLVAAVPAAEEKPVVDLEAATEKTAEHWPIGEHSLLTDKQLVERGFSEEELQGMREETVADCLEPSVVAQAEAPVPVPEKGWTRTAIRKLKIDDVYRLVEVNLGAKIPDNVKKTHAQDWVIDFLGL